MKALCWHGRADVSVIPFPIPGSKIRGDTIIRVTSTAICGSDIHLYDGYQPTMEEGDILGHENMGRGSRGRMAVRNLKKGDRVVVRFTISCRLRAGSARRRSFPCATPPIRTPKLRARLWGNRPLGCLVFRICSADSPVGNRTFVYPSPMSVPSRCPEGIDDEKSLFLSDVLPTAYVLREGIMCCRKGGTLSVPGV